MYLPHDLIYTIRYTFFPPPISSLAPCALKCAAKQTPMDSFEMVLTVVILDSNTVWKFSYKLFYFRKLSPARFVLSEIIRSLLCS